MMLRSLTVVGCLSLCVADARAADPTVAGRPSAPHPTVHNISIEWPITGDDDADGVVALRYRQSGETAWINGMPLRRVPAGSAEGFSWVNKHAGSVFGLSPATSYEIELALTDPDGGSAMRTLTVSTRPVPADAPNATMQAATPATLEGVLAGAAPGQVILLADGAYAGFTASVSGTLEAPIVIRAEHAGAAVIDGEVRLDGLSYVFVDGLTVHAKIKFNDATGIVVVNTTIATPDYGIQSLGTGSTDGYFCDNVITGPTGWANDTVGAEGNNLGEGIEVTGPGNVICHNRVQGFRDCISTLEDTEAVDQFSIDVYGNDLDLCADDAVEADFTMGNVRVYENRITNSFVGLSSQPGLGGPAYFVRNVMYNVIYSPFKLHRFSVGDVAFHNTVVKCGDAFAVFSSDPWSRALFRNNLFVGGEGGGTYGGYSNGSGRVLYLPAADASCSFDYDGFGSIGTGTFTGEISGVPFNSLSELQQSTSEQHAVAVDLAVFDTGVPFPTTPFPELPPPVLTLAAGSAAVDSGLAIANINDGFAGTAPDLGAYELGAPLPEYGPRTSGEGGGPSGSGGATGSGSGSGSGGADANGNDDGEGGCACRQTGRPAGSALALGLLLAAFAGRRRIAGFGRQLQAIERAVNKAE